MTMTQASLIHELIIANICCVVFTFAFGIILFIVIMATRPDVQWGDDRAARSKARADRKAAAQTAQMQAVAAEVAKIMQGGTAP